jgi:hypothetical protein
LQLVLVVVQAVQKMVHQDLVVVAVKMVQAVVAEAVARLVVKVVQTVQADMHQAVTHQAVVVEVVDIVVAITVTLLTKMVAVVEVVEVAQTSAAQQLLVVGLHNLLVPITTVMVELAGTKAVAQQVL